MPGASMLLWSGLHPRIMATQTSLDTLSRKLTRKLGYSRYLLKLHETHMLHQISDVDMNLRNPERHFLFTVWGLFAPQVLASLTRHRKMNFYVHLTQFSVVHSIGCSQSEALLQYIGVFYKGSVLLVNFRLTLKSELTNSTIPNINFNNQRWQQWM